MIYRKSASRVCLLAAMLAAMCAVRASAYADEPQVAPPQPPAAPQNPVAQHLQDISVTIVSKSPGLFGGGGEGSGVIKTRGDSNFVWTAAHVVDNLRRTKEVIDASGSRRTVVEFDDAMVVKSLVEDGRTVGKTEFYAKIVRYSHDEDLALLQLRKKGFVKSSVTFDLDEAIVPVGTKLLHVGSLLGQLGSNSMTEGIMSQHGRLIEGRVFDQTTVTAFPGSSGGGVYLADGRLVGLVLRGAGETFNLIVPVRRMRDWAKRAGVEWAIDDAVPMPNEQELEALPVEDSGRAGSHQAPGHEPHSQEASLFGPPSPPERPRVREIGPFVYRN